MITCIFFTVIGLVAAFDSHNFAKDPIPNMYTLHSWVGLTSVILFCCQVNSDSFLSIGQFFSGHSYYYCYLTRVTCVLQWIAGLVSFLYPGVQANIRSAYMPVHVYFGVAGFMGAIAACLIGLNEKAFWVT